MWCKTCNCVANANECGICGNITEEYAPIQTMWCSHCSTPIIKTADMI